MKSFTEIPFCRTDESIPYHGVAHVGEVEEGEGNADESVEDGH